jgi:hypothetical protein
MLARVDQAIVDRLARQIAGGKRRHMLLSPAVRKRLFYSVPAAGQKLGWGRSESYRAVERGDIPVEKFGPKLLLVPREQWDAIVRHLLKGELRRCRAHPIGGGHPDHAVQSRVTGVGSG